MIAALPIAASSGGNFLVSPSLGLMIWTLVAFFITFLLLRKLAFPRIQEALEKRQNAIEDSIDAAERTRTEADALLSEYRERLKEARAQAEEIAARARRPAGAREPEALEEGKPKREELPGSSRGHIETETQRPIQE